MVTLRQLLTQSGIAFTRKDIQQIGMWCKALAVAGEYKIHKVEETVGEETYTVNAYEADFEQTMVSEIIAHFQKKSNG